MTQPDLGRRPDCPALEALAEPRSLEVRAHIASCAACRAEVELITTFESGEPTNAERADLDWIEARLKKSKPRLTAPRRWWQIPLAPRLAMAGASLILVIAIAVQWNNGQVRPLDETGPTGTVLRSDRSLDWKNSAAGDQPQLPARLEWTPVQGASYLVELLEVDGTVAWKSASLAQPFLDLPPELPALAGARRTFAWRVTAADAQGRTVAESPRLSFRVVPATKP